MKAIPYLRVIMLSLFSCASAASAIGAPVDLNTWTAESYSSVSGFGAGSWIVGGGGDFVSQVVNGQPTIFYSDFNVIGSDVRGKLQVETGGDDDFVGFVLGFEPGDTTDPGADYLLVDWKQVDQSFNFGGNAATNATPGTVADEGLAASRVTGTPSADEMWGHTNFLVENPGGGLDELARGINLSDTGWDDFVEYEFRFIYTMTSLQVFVDDVLELDISGTFPDGRLGFYNFSQSNVKYSAFTIDPAPPPAPVPEPATVTLLGLGLWGLVVAKKRWC